MLAMIAIGPTGSVRTTGRTCVLYWYGGLVLICIVGGRGLPGTLHCAYIIIEVLVFKREAAN